ncbi:L-aspartate oxidase, partial [Nitratireductor sp. GCM10026969]
LHGANRLASNSLLEAAVYARSVAESVAGAPAAHGSRQHRVETTRPDPTPLRPIVSRALGLVRTEDDLRQAIAELLPRATSESPEADPAIVALMLAVAALQRRESRGAHFRIDFPHKAEKAQSSRLTFAEALATAREAACAPAPSFARSA